MQRVCCHLVADQGTAAPHGSEPPARTGHGGGVKGGREGGVGRQSAATLCLFSSAILY